VKIAIAGAGIAGLAGALSLARSLPHSHIRVHERSATISTQGAGIQLGPNAFAALEKISQELSESLKSVIVRPERVVMKDFSTGKALTTVKLGSDITQTFGQPYGVLHRATLLERMLAACEAQRNIEIEFGSSFQSALSSQADLLIGADGLWSSARKEVLGEAAVRLSSIAFRGFAPWSGPQLDVQVWTGPGVHVVCYPVMAPLGIASDQAMVLNVAIFVSGHRQQMLDETLPKTDQTSWATQVSAQEILAALPSPESALRELLISVTQASAWRVFDQATLPAWHRDKTLLVGDAAHAMLPHLAQGAAFALEDAAELANQIKTNPQALEAAFQGFYAARAPRCLRAQRTARRYQKIYHASGLLRLARNGVLSLPLLSPAFGGLSWVYGYV
jgi:salicylate hydroxylase